MSNVDKILADRVVALGVGFKDLNNKKSGKYIIDNHSRQNASFLTTEQFLSDWRVAGALMEKIPIASGETPLLLMMAKAITIPEKENESLPRSVIEACVEALE